MHFLASPSGRSPAEIVGSNPTGDMDVCCECCVLSGRGLCDELITRPEESYRLCCVVVCDLETSRTRRPWPTLGRSATAKKKECILLVIFIVVSRCSDSWTSNEPSGLKHVKDTKKILKVINWNINLGNVRFVGLCCIIFVNLTFWHRSFTFQF